MKRFAVLIVALLVGATAPARAWCEASCVAPSHHGSESATPHCPAHDSTTGTSITASASADCPVVETARPTQSRLEAQHLHAFVSSHLRTLAPPHLDTFAPSARRTVTRSRLTTPLRI